VPAVAVFLRLTRTKNKELILAPENEFKRNIKGYYDSDYHGEYYSRIGVYFLTDLH
jgi:hypothetical protein